VSQYYDRFNPWANDRVGGGGTPGKLDDAKNGAEELQLTSSKHTH
jgi:hypothetical protein